MQSLEANSKFTTRSGLKLQKLVRHKDGVRYLSKKWHLRVQHNGARRWIPLAENPKSAERMANDFVRILNSSDGHSLTISEALKLLEQDGRVRSLPGVGWPLVAASLRAAGIRSDPGH